ncbi:MAG: hypothetical protein KJ613_04875 [Nanoarchaeota archaeon]|nr:hypothetical protein [Nanoarchaeota archaeon]
MKASINFIFIFFIVALFSLSGCRNDPIGGYHSYDDYYYGPPPTYYSNLVVENHTMHIINICVDGYYLGSVYPYDYVSLYIACNRYCMWFEQPYTGARTSKQTVYIIRGNTTICSVYQNNFYWW